MSSFAPVECSICYDAIGDKNNCVTPCGHVFCFHCVVQCLSKKNTCPCCRTVLREELEDADDDEEDDEEDEGDDESEEDDDEGEHPEIIAERMEKIGYTMTDIITLFTGRMSRAVGSAELNARHEKWLQCRADFETIEEELDREIEENQMFAAEDVAAV